MDIIETKNEENKTNENKLYIIEEKKEENKNNIIEANKVNENKMDIIEPKNEEKLVDENQNNIITKSEEKKENEKKDLIEIKNEEKKENFNHNNMIDTKGEEKKGDQNNTIETKGEEKKENDNKNKEAEKEDGNKDEDDLLLGEENDELIETPGPLDGKQIVITGETVVPKEYFRVLLSRLGARVTFSVSKKTSFLIHGEMLEDGRDYFEGNKYKAARKRRIPIYSVKKFEEYMQNLVNDKTWNLKDQVQLMDGKDQIVVKNIKKAIGLASHSALMGNNRKNRAKRKEKKIKDKEKKKEKEEKKKEREKKKKKKEKEKEKEIGRAQSELQSHHSIAYAVFGL